MTFVRQPSSSAACRGIKWKLESIVVQMDTSIGRRAEDVNDPPKFQIACTGTHVKGLAFQSNGATWVNEGAFFSKKDLNLYKSALKKYYKHKTVISLLFDTPSSLTF